MDERERRIGRNEALFREVNERLNDVNSAFAGLSGVMEILCECGDIACTNQLTIPPGEYQHIRSDPTWFAVIPGHDVIAVEQIISSHASYDIVQKRPGSPAAQAAKTHPR